MTTQERPSGLSPLTLGPAAAGALLLVLLGFLAAQAWGLSQREMWTPGNFLVDFDVFHLAGQLAREGRAEEAYRFADFAAAQSAMGGGDKLMPWTYPPAYLAVVAPLSLLPVWLAFALFSGLAMGAYLWVLRRMAGPGMATVVLALMPCLLVTVFSGQNGFLTATLAGLFALMTLRGQRGAGLPLGLMAIKPHLGLGLGLSLLLRRRWAWAAQAVGVALGGAALATLWLGPGIWGEFQGAVRESKQMLSEGSYPLHRMVSVYAGLRSVGLGPGMALAAHLAVTAAGVAVLHLAVRQGWQPRRLLAVALVASLLVSPYLYDYDLPLLGLAVALVLDDLARASRRALAAGLALSWVAGGYGMSSTLVLQALESGGSEVRPVSVGSFAFLALAALLVAQLYRVERAAAAPTPGEAGAVAA